MTGPRRFRFRVVAQAALEVGGECPFPMVRPGCSGAVKRKESVMT